MHPWGLALAGLWRRGVWAVGGGPRGGAQGAGLRPLARLGGSAVSLRVARAPLPHHARRRALPSELLQGERRNCCGRPAWGESQAVLKSGKGGGTRIASPRRRPNFPTCGRGGLTVARGRASCSSSAGALRARPWLGQAVGA
jgi:hypothetical protein